MWKSLHRLRKCGIALLIAAFMSGCSTASGPGAFVPPAPSAPQTEYRIRAGDTLNLKFYYHPDHDQEIVVRLDGKILFPLIGEVQAAGLSPAQLAEQIVQRYSSSLRNPEVSVGVKAMSDNRVYIGGEVNRPGFVQYRQGLTAIQAVLEAGGPKDTAKVEDVVLLQKVGEAQYRASKINLAKVIEEGDTQSDLAVGPSDVLFVPKTTIAKVNQFVEQYIIGVIPLRSGASLPIIIP